MHHYNTGQFPGWGRPHWFISEQYMDLGRTEEARDAARFALSDPSWATLGADYEAVVERAGWAGKSVTEIKEFIAQRRGPNAAAFDGPKSPEQLASEEAQLLIDKTVAGDATVEDIVQRLAECYMNLDKTALAKFVMCASVSGV